MNVKKDASTEIWIDPDDAPELTDDHFSKAVKIVGEKAVETKDFREAVAAARRGRPKSANPKQPVYIRFSPEVVAYFKSTGKGWQTRINEVLKEWIREHGNG